MKAKVLMKTSGREVRGTSLGESFISSGPEAGSCQGLCPQILGCWSYICFLLQQPVLPGHSKATTRVPSDPHSRTSTGIGFILKHLPGLWKHLSSHWWEVRGERCCFQTPRLFLFFPASATGVADIAQAARTGRKPRLGRKDRLGFKLVLTGVVLWLEVKQVL